MNKTNLGESEIIKKNQILEPKNDERNEKCNSTCSRVEQMKDRISDLENKSFEIIQKE